MTSRASARFDNDLRYRAADHPKNTAFTPRYVVDAVERVLGRIGLDPCTTADNPVGASAFLTAEMDGLSWPWGGQTVFVNPPYGKAREPWVEKCIFEAAMGTPIILLIPSHTDTKAWQRAFVACHSICFVQGRVKFGTLRPNRRQEAASHPSALFGFNCDVSACGLGEGVLRRSLEAVTPSVAEGQRAEPPTHANRAEGVAVGCQICIDHRDGEARAEQPASHSAPANEGSGE